MRKSRSFTGTVSALAVVVFAVVAPPADAWDAPGRNTVGLVWDPSHYVWIASDQDENMVFFTGHLGDTWNQLPGWSGKPGPLTVDASGLWVVKEDEGDLVHFDFSSSPPVQTAVPIPSEAVREFHAITGLAWDGNHLWIATGCGLCSRIVQFDVNQRKVIQTFFPSCDPRGLVFRPSAGSAGNKLTTVAYSGPFKTAYFSSWKLVGSPATASSFQEFMTFGSGVIPPKDPTAIGIRNGAIWVVDRATARIQQYYLGDMP